MELEFKPWKPTLTGTIMTMMMISYGTLSWLIVSRFIINIVSFNNMILILFKKKINLSIIVWHWHSYQISLKDSGNMVNTDFIAHIQLIFSLSRYEAVIDAYLDGLEASGLSDLSKVTSVASFFVSRVDTLVDKMLEKIGTPEALDLRGKVILILLAFQ